MLMNRGIGPEYAVAVALTAVGDLNFGAECDLQVLSGGGMFSDETGNVIEGSAGQRSPRSFP